MTALPKPDVIITHESDLDGFLSGLLLQRLAKHLFGVTVKLEAYHYNYWKQRDLREKSAWVTDLAFETRMDKPDWVVIDHHVTDATPKQARLIHDVTKSAGTLCYELCQANGLGSPELDRLAHLNDVADLFLESDPDFTVAGDYASLVKCYQFWNLHTVIDGELEKLLNHPLLEVMSVKRRIEDPIGLDWSRKRVLELSPTVAYVETVIGSSNQIVHQLLETRETKFPVLMTLFRRSNSIFASFRSRNGEALAVATKFQGGGHANAAGAILPKSVRTIEDGIEFVQKALNPKPLNNVSLNSLEGLFAKVDVKK